MTTQMDHLMKQTLVPLHLEEITGDTLRLLRTIIPKAITITPRLGQPCPQILGDAGLISQVIVKLCLNAAQAMRPRPGGLLEVSVTSVSLIKKELPCSASGEKIPADNHVRLMVRDTGIGMDVDHQQRAFSRFSPTKATGDNVGLGLSVAHDIVERLHGHLTVHSEPGMGTTFSLFFPALDVAHTWMGRGERILLVDDDEDLAVVMNRILIRQNYAVSKFTDALEAWESFRATSEGYDLILTDMNLPGMSGIDLALRVFSLHPDTPVILTTGANMGIDETQIRKLGIHSLLLKPAGKINIIKAVREGLDGKQCRHPRVSRLRGGAVPRKGDPKIGCRACHEYDTSTR